MSDTIDNITNNEDYKYGFTSNIETDIIPCGLNEDVVRLISKKKNEPAWLLELRLKAYRHWLTMKMPDWAHLKIPQIDYQDISYYAAPRHISPPAPQRGEFEGNTTSENGVSTFPP